MQRDPFNGLAKVGAYWDQYVSAAQRSPVHAPLRSRPRWTRSCGWEVAKPFSHPGSRHNFPTAQFRARNDFITALHLRLRTLRPRLPPRSPSGLARTERPAQATPRPAGTPLRASPRTLLLLELDSEVTPASTALRARVIAASADRPRTPAAAAGEERAQGSAPRRSRAVRMPCRWRVRAPSAATRGGSCRGVTGSVAGVTGRARLLVRRLRRLVTA